MFESYKKIFFVGIKGVAMANLARIFTQLGKKVLGSDIASGFITDSILNDLGIDVIDDFSVEKLPDDINLVVYAASHGGVENPQVIEAKKRGIKIIHQAVLIGELSSIFSNIIAVAGCHGKTTTSSLLAYSLINLKANSSHLIGVPIFDSIPGGEYKGRNFFVVEADEYGMNPPEDITPKFHKLFPDYAIITNIDHDHPDIYKTFEDVEESFGKFVENVAKSKKSDPRLVICGDDGRLVKLFDNIEKNLFIAYGLDAKNEIWAEDIISNQDSTIFTINSPSFNIKEKKITTSIFGEKNVLNILGVISILLILGFKIDDIINSFLGFTGAKRRFELVASVNGYRLFDDYAHHPKEIEATIAAFKSRYPQSRLIIIFQPHTYLRTRELMTEFVESFKKVEQVILLPIFKSAREVANDSNVSSKMLEKKSIESGNAHVYAVESEKAAIKKLTEILQKGDIVCTMGAGDVYKMKGEIAKLLNC